LGLTAAQVAQLRAARQTLMTTIHDLVDQLRAGTITPAGFEAGVEAAQAGFETSVQTILTAEQYAQLQAARRDRLITHLTARLATFDVNVTRHVRALDRILDLSDTQVADITTILTNAKPAVEAVLAGLRDHSLTPQAAHAQLKQIAVDTAAAIRATLTPEQAAIFDTLAHLRRMFPGCRP
jgi:Spy/CpxP family protein refolding chaperone